MKICVLAVLNVFKPALLMPLSVQTKPCILLFLISVLDVNFCVAPCPTDCISMIKVKKDIDNWDWKFDPKLVIPVVNTTEIEKKLVVGESESHG